MSQICMQPNTNVNALLIRYGVYGLRTSEV